MIVALTVRGADLEPVGAARQQRLVRHPDQRGLELVGDLGGASARDQQIAARDVDLVGQRQGDRLAGDRFVEVAVGGDDARDRRALAPTGRRAARRPA